MAIGRPPREPRRGRRALRRAAVDRGRAVALSAADQATALDRLRPWWLPARGAWAGHVQTIWPALFVRGAALSRPPRRERWTAPDGDFIDADILTEPARPADAAKAPMLALFHGLEGSSHSNYAQAFGAVAEALGWTCVVPHFRGCSGSPNLAPRAYHSGDFEEIAWMLHRLRTGHRGPLLACGVSLGGNALLRWAEEAGDAAGTTVQAVAALSSPVDLGAAGRAIDRGVNAQLYARTFLRTMKPRALAKLAQYPGLFDRRALLAARTLYDFDNVFTAPLHGYANTDDYWRRASAAPRLGDIRLPALLVNARNDPFVPIASVPHGRALGRHVDLWQPAHGGHAGFASGRFPGHVRALPTAVCAWLAEHI